MYFENNSVIKCIISVSISMGKNLITGNRKHNINWNNEYKPQNYI